MDIITDKLSIKNLLFTKAIANYNVPGPISGHKVFPCTDCGDKFMFESSLSDHVNRKSIKISYMCRYCNSQRVFHNRCNLLSHIRSHAFKTATINVTDLKVEPLPLRFFKMKSLGPLDLLTDTSKQTVTEPRKSSITCYECKANITITGIAYKDRASHFMKYSNEVYACPVCLFALPSVCALRAHLRIHLQCVPFYCPECGIHLSNKNVQYPYNHDCEGFKMMRATARSNCSVPDCCLFHPNNYKDHMRKYHLKTVYKCPFCVVACFNESTMNKHLQGHNTTSKPLLFYQCDVCPGRYVLQNPKLNDNHLKSHVNTTIFPCWACGSHYKEISTLLLHFIKSHSKSDNITNAIKSVFNDCPANTPKSQKIYRVVKRCEQCKRSFTYKCKYEDIQVLPSECPFKCVSTMASDVTPENTPNDNNDNFIRCHLCQDKVLQDWAEIKKHYAALHKTHKCLDAEILLTRIDIKKYLSEKKNTSKKIGKISRKNKKLNKCSTLATTASKSSSLSNGDNELYDCKMCGNRYEQKSLLEDHMITHRDPCMAYQCLECGQSFVVKPSFSKHLLLEHGITDVEDYISGKQCYNGNALLKYQNTVEIEIPLSENQCRICRDLFDSPEDLEKHFRVHGMAFLMKNTSDRNTTNL